jgi:hypothetical protein
VVPQGTPHALGNRTKKPVHFLNSGNPAGFEQFFADIEATARHLPYGSPEFFSELMNVYKKDTTEMLGPAPKAELVIRRSAALRSTYSLPGECSNLFLFRRVRPHDNSQSVAGYLELAHEVLAHISGRERAFEVMRNCVSGLVYRVRTKVCVVSIDRLAVLTWSGARRATINCDGTVKSHELRRHVPTGVVYQITLGRLSEARILNGSAILRPNNSGDEPPCANQLPSAARDIALQSCVSISLLSRPGNYS